MKEKKVLGIPGGFETAAWQFIWQHKKDLFALLAFPLFLQMGLAYFFNNIGPLDMEYFGLLDITVEKSMLRREIVFAVLNAFWVVGWLRYIINNEKPTLRTYFKWDKSYFLYIAYTLIWLFIIYGIRASVVGNIGLTFLTKILLVIGLLLIYGLLLSFSFWVPAIATGKPLSFKIWKQVKPFYWGYFGSLIFMSIRMEFITYALFFPLLGIDILLRFNDIHMGLYPYRCISIFSDYLFILGAISVAAMYYKHYLNGKRS